MDKNLMLLLAMLGLNPMSAGQALGQGATPLNAPSMDRNVLEVLLQQARSATQYNPQLMQTLRTLAARLPQMVKQAPQAGAREFGGMNALPFPVPQQLVQQLMQQLNPQG
jgi:hypothetical protein